MGSSCRSFLKGLIYPITLDQVLELDSRKGWFWGEREATGRLSRLDRDKRALHKKDFTQYSKCISLTVTH